MKQFAILLILSLLAINHLTAQQISVASFTLLPNDLDARQNFPLRDQNGTLCAIIKVQTTYKDFQFDNGTLGITKTENHPGEIWLYVPSKTKFLTIAHDQLGLLRNYIIPENIEQGRVYELKLTTGKITTIITNDVASQWLVIKSTPDGADVYIDDVLTGTTPFQKEIAIGKHNYRISKELYYPDAGIIELDISQKTSKEFILRPNYGFADIKTTPSEAELAIDGMPLVQASPSRSGMLKSGQHIITAHKLLYHDASTSVSITDGQTSHVELVLKATFGNIQISNTPESGASVTLNGQPTGKTTPCTLEKVPAGEHSLTLRREWYEPYTEKVSLVEGEQKVVNIDMKPAWCKAQVSTSPESDLYIDGEKKGLGNWTGRLSVGLHTFEAKKEKYHDALQKFEIGAGQEQIVNLQPIARVGTLRITTMPIDAAININGENKGTSPITLRNLQIGDYTVILSLAGYGTVTKTVTIVEGQTVEVNETLPSGKEVTITSIPSGAKLYIDGVSTDTTPYAGALSFGSHKIKVDNAGTIIEQSIDVIQNGVSSWTFKVQKDIIDADGNIYKVIAIGTQIWMAENLRTTKFKDGTTIPKVSDDAKWTELSTPAYCWYANNETGYKELCGALYNWYTVNTGKLCPSGWHVPSDAEWTTLTDYLGGESLAGGKLKEVVNTHWGRSNDGADKSSGFTALPGGYRVSTGSFYGVGNYGNWWSSSKYDSGSAWYRGMYYSSNSVGRVVYSMVDGFSVRCIKNELIPIENLKASTKIKEKSSSKNKGW
jgi:uncharacterized protein (TIGR02145 family)